MKNLSMLIDEVRAELINPLLCRSFFRTVSLIALHVFIDNGLVHLGWNGSGNWRNESNNFMNVFLKDFHLTDIIKTNMLQETIEKKE